MTERQGRRRKQLLNDLNKTRGYWKLKEVALDSTLWRTGYGTVVKDYGMNEWMNLYPRASCAGC